MELTLKVAGGLSDALLGVSAGDIYTQDQLQWLSYNLSIKNGVENLFFPPKLPRDEISDIVSLSPGNIMCWCIFPERGDSTCPREHIGLKFLNDTKLGGMQKRCSRWQNWDRAW